jgi:hypothetical protein
MPAKSVVQMSCERCPRVWYLTDKEVQDGERITVTIGSTKCVEYSVLCENCRKTVMEHLSLISKSMRNNSPQRGAKKKGGVAADPPSSPTPTAAGAGVPELAAPPPKVESGPGSSTSASSSSSAGRRSPESPSVSGGPNAEHHLGGR